MIARLANGSLKRQSGTFRGARWLVLLALAAAAVAAIVGWRAAALGGSRLQLSDVFDAGIVTASSVVLAFGHRSLRRVDWLVAAATGAAMGLLVPSTGFYPLLGWAARPGGPAWVAALHGAGVAAALLAGLVVMRSGGPVASSFARGRWAAGLRSLGFGAVVGLPLAAVNAYANTLTQGRPFELQGSLFALLEALEPGIVEEVVYRFALLGIVWLVLRPSWGGRAAWMSGVFVLLVHSYAHYGHLLLEQPLLYVGFGAVLAIVWGLPLTFLALRRDLESAVGFHWVQDAVRFLGGL